MERHEILEAMSELKLYGMRASFDEIAGKGLARRDEIYPLIASLIRAERTHRQARSISYRIGGAKFPVLEISTRSPPPIRHDQPIFPNLAKNIVLDGPDQLWVADITYVSVVGSFVYIAVILDAWSRRVVGYAISIDARLTLAALSAAI